MRNLFRRKSTAAAPARPSTEDAAAVPAELTAELQDAWADLEDAVKDAKVVKVKACTWNGADWREDPRAVRAVAGMLRKYGSSDDPI